MTITSEYTFDTDKKLFIRKDTQNVDAIIDQNTAERNSGENAGRYRNMRKCASIPIVVVQALKNRPWSEGGPIDLNLIGSDPDHAARFTRWLNDRDNAKFRTNEARI